MRHLVKLCVGVTEIEYLQTRAEQLSKAGRDLIIHTRQFPKAADELLDGGSLFWVIKGQILVRQRITAIEQVGTKEMPLCEIALEPKIILTEPQPRRPFQGWRYLDPKDAPGDLNGPAGGGDLPQALASELKDLGLW